MIKLTKYELTEYQRHQRTAQLVRIAYDQISRKSSISPEKIYALCQLTWLDGKKAPHLWVLWDKEGIAPKSDDGLVNTKFPEQVVRQINLGIGIANFYKAYRNSSLDWIRANYKKISLLLNRAANIKTDSDAVQIGIEISKLPGIPKMNHPENKMNPVSLLSPLFACVDKRLRFPFINKNENVVELHKNVGISNKSLSEQIRTLCGLIGQYGVKDSLMLDVIGHKLQFSSIKTDRSKLKKSEIYKELSYKEDSDIEYFRKSKQATLTRLHNTMTNAFLEISRQLGKQIRVGNKSNMYDILVLNYNDKGRDLLVEAKSAVNRPDIRLAIGQLYDYRRGLSKRPVTDLAVLLPSKPASDEFLFLEDVGIGVLWFTNKTISKLGGNVTLK